CTRAAVETYSDFDYW
nr:immunoglobulin heavy chain junction region [Macaca mulatta]MOV48291.1 immunoglobulin heavy chain junction region [Macaca mulatta]MOV52058.1 immunoglobulin heavy chain junction region [Macaca mulatta]